MDAVGTIARLTWTRMWRGRSVWVIGGLVLLALLVALAQRVGPLDAATRWRVSCEFWLRFLVTVGAAVHLANAVGEEVESQTYTYLWVRPFPRRALVLGKLAAVIPWLWIASLVAMPIAWLLAAGDELGATAPSLGRGLLAALAGSVAASVFAVGVGTLFRRHPFVLVLAYFLGIEQILTGVPNLGAISFLEQTRVLAALEPGDAATALASLAVLTAAWLAVALWRVSTADYGSADR